MAKDVVVLKTESRKILKGIIRVEDKSIWDNSVKLQPL